ncbi:MAG: cysteine synthase A [Bacteroidetes bacterium]|nr:cysteine synthase A [Bacteroidota bacterium]
MKIANNILELIGNTPLVKLNKISENCEAIVLAKLEFFNPSSSVKDRIALSMINDAEKTGKIDKSTVIIEPTSGNTGIGLAMVCTVKGYRLILTMPESMSIERRNILKGFGAEIELTPATKGMKGAIERADELSALHEKSFIPMQFSNPANTEVHMKTTAEEIWRDTDGKIDIFVAGVGTGGTISGVAEVLKIKNPLLQAIAVEPADSPVLSGGAPSPHKIQGLGAGFIPDILNVKIIDEIVTVTNQNAIVTAQKLIKEEGILCGISSGANAWAALLLAKRKENKGKTIVFMVCDTAERYLSTDLYKFE